MYGTGSAATVANNMFEDLHGNRVRSCGGHWRWIPNSNTAVDVRLGDPVVSQPDGTHGGVVQCDLGKNLGDGVFERKGILRSPPTLGIGYVHTGPERDVLHCSSVEGHKDGSKEGHH